MTGNRQVRFLGECERATFQSYPTRAVKKSPSSLTLIKNVACRNCERVLLYAAAIADSLDWRFSSSLCARLDLIHRDNWAKTVQKQSELRKQTHLLVDDLAQSKSIRLRRRTPSEEMSARRKHQDIINSL